MPMKLRAQTKKMAATRAYLSTLLNGDTWRLSSIVGRWCGIVLGGGLLLVALLGVARVLEPGFGLWAGINALLIGSGIGWSTYLSLRNRRRVIGDQALVRDAKELGSKLNASIVQNRLYREMTPPTMDLLEGAARSWQRVMDATDGSVWKNTVLTGSLQGVREQARRAADQAMLEILVHLRPEFREVGSPTTLVQGIQTVLDAIGVSFGSEEQTQPLPATLGPAQHAAADLAQLANEIEQVAIDALRQASPLGQSSQESIRQTLADLHQIREARAELEVETRH